MVGLTSTARRSLNLRLYHQEHNYLNVIESVFSGMSRAVIHNSDFKDAAQARDAIDAYLADRNEFYRLHPKRAGRKLWGHERSEAEFREENNCKDPKIG